jgi:hypothetical protein
MKKILFPVLGIMLFFNLSGQETEIKHNRNNEIGIHAGSTTGLGLSYRHWFGKAGLQLTGIPIKTDNTEIYSIGLTALYTFYEAHYIKVFGYLGNHYFVDKEYGTDQFWNHNSYDPFSSPENNTFEHASYNIGFGPGFAFGKIVTFNLMIGYGFYDVLYAFDMYPAGEIGVYYSF